MASVCDICGKKPSFGMNVSHSHRRTKRRWNPNVQRVRAVVDGAPKRLHVCTSCIRAGKVTKPLRRTHETAAAEPATRLEPCASRSHRQPAGPSQLGPGHYPRRCCQPSRSRSCAASVRTSGPPSIRPDRDGAPEPRRGEGVTQVSASAVPAAVSSSS